MGYQVHGNLQPLVKMWFRPYGKAVSLMIVEANFVAIIILGKNGAILLAPTATDLYASLYEQLFISQLATPTSADFCQILIKEIKKMMFCSYCKVINGFERLRL